MQNIRAKNLKDNSHEWVEHISHSNFLYDIYGKEEGCKEDQEDREKEEHEEAQIVFKENPGISRDFL